MIDWQWMLREQYRKLKGRPKRTIKRRTRAGDEVHTVIISWVPGWYRVLCGLPRRYSAIVTMESGRQEGAVYHAYGWDAFLGEYATRSQAEAAARICIADGFQSPDQP